MAELISNILFIFQRINFLALVDIFLVTMIFFVLLLFVRNTQAMALLRGVLSLFIVISLLTALFDLPAFSWLVRNAVPALLVAIPVIFAPEIRRALERLGRAQVFRPTERTRNRNDSQDVISAVAQAAARLSGRRHGALIVIERLDDLGEYVQTGVPLNAEVSTQILLQLFYPNTPLHDGAVIISDNRVLGAGCVMPLSASGVLADSPERQMGLRHRAALGSSEVSDAIAIVVSEETGAVSLAYGGRIIHRLDRERLEGVLRAFFKPIETRSGFEDFVYRFMPFLTPETPRQEP